MGLPENYVIHSMVGWNQLVQPSSSLLHNSRVNLGVKNLVNKTLRPLFTKLLTPGLTCELCNPFDDWLESISPTIIQRITLFVD